MVNNRKISETAVNDRKLAVNYLNYRQIIVNTRKLSIRTLLCREFGRKVMSWEFIKCSNGSLKDSLVTPEIWLGLLKSIRKLDIIMMNYLFFNADYAEQCHNGSPHPMLSSFSEFTLTG